MHALGSECGKTANLRCSAENPGEHHASNALAAATVGLAFDVPLRRICGALMEFKPASKRMEVLEVLSPHL
jgi:UDP-N-acetylmuramyl pentapeptide synthase